MTSSGKPGVATLFSLAGKTAVVTGAAGYLGRIFAQSLLEAGATVVLMGRGGALVQAATQLRALHGRQAVDSESVDFSDKKALRQALSSVADRHATVDVLVNNAFSFSRETGFNDPSGRMESLSRDQWMHSLESGVYWHALATQVFIGNMVKRGTGSIINVSSMYAIVSPDPALYEGTNAFNPPSYGAAKAALLALTRYTASFYGRHGVRCNALLPGAFPNFGGDSYNAPRNEAFLQRLRDRAVLGRFGEPDDLKGAIVFLASDASRYMTGQCLSVDGGWTIR
jgi:gluconate 5-dehydrogenase